MTAGDYARWTAPLRARPRARAVLFCANRALTLLGYALYPLLLVLAWLWARPLLWRALVVAPVAFVAFSLLRARIDAPRPYEALDIDPLLARKGGGVSFPSRHAFSLSLIGMCWLPLCAPVGWAIVVAAALLGVVRVLGGIHWPRDVAWGLALGVACGLLVCL